MELLSSAISQFNFQNALNTVTTFISVPPPPPPSESHTIFEGIRKAQFAFSNFRFAPIWVKILVNMFFPKFPTDFGKWGMLIALIGGLYHTSFSMIF